MGALKVMERQFVVTVETCGLGACPLSGEGGAKTSHGRVSRLSGAAFRHAGQASFVEFHLIVPGEMTVNVRVEAVGASAKPEAEHKH